MFSREKNQRTITKRSWLVNLFYSVCVVIKLVLYVSVLLVRYFSPTLRDSRYAKTKERDQCHKIAIGYY